LDREWQPHQSELTDEGIQPAGASPPPRQGLFFLSKCVGGFLFKSAN